MRALGLLPLPGRLEQLQTILADRLQHLKTWLLSLLLALLQQALVKEGSHALEHPSHFTIQGRSDRLDG